MGGADGGLDGKDFGGCRPGVRVLARPGLFHVMFLLLYFWDYGVIVVILIGFGLAFARKWGRGSSDVNKQKAVAVFGIE